MFFSESLISLEFRKCLCLKNIFSFELPLQNTFSLNIQFETNYFSYKLTFQFTVSFPNTEVLHSDHKCLKAFSSTSFLSEKNFFPWHFLIFCLYTSIPDDNNVKMLWLFSTSRNSIFPNSFTTILQLLHEPSETGEQEELMLLLHQVSPGVPM